MTTRRFPPPWQVEQTPGALCGGCTFESFRPFPPNSLHSSQHVVIPIDGARQRLANFSGPHDQRIFTLRMWSEFCPSWRVDDQIVSDLELVWRNLCVRVHRRNPQGFRCCAKGGTI